MKSIYYILITCILLVNLSSCSQDQDNEIEAELQIHFYNFVEEAVAHGMDVSIDDLDIGGYVENIQQRGTLGQCKSYSDGSKKVVIDQSYWERADAMEQEYIVFHELGHCVLGRDHNDDKDSSGECISIMQSGGGVCDGAYTLENRSEMLEELFE